MIENEIVLKNSKWEAHILPSFGNNVICLKKDGKYILRSPNKFYELKNNPVLYGTPLLFPPNRIKDGKFTFEGKEYHFPINEPSAQNHIHGFMMDAPFQIESIHNNVLRCVYENHAEHDESRFPFSFIMTIQCTLTEAGLHQQVEIYNSGKSAMPVLLGFHTTFTEPKSFSVPIGKRWETGLEHIPTGKQLELTSEEQSYRSGCSPAGKTISGFFAASEHTAQIGDIYYHTSKNFTQWILYNGGGKGGFFCAEPQSGPVNGLNMPDGFVSLQSGKTVTYWCQFSDHLQYQ